MKREKLIVKRCSIIDSLIISALGISLILYGIGIIKCYDPKFLSICVGTVLIVNVIDDILSIRNMVECEKNG